MTHKMLYNITFQWVSFPWLRQFAQAGLQLPKSVHFEGVHRRRGGAEHGHLDVGRRVDRRHLHRVANRDNLEQDLRQFWIVRFVGHLKSRVPVINLSFPYYHIEQVTIA